MLGRHGRVVIALGGLALLLCAAAPLEKAPAGQQVEHRTQSTAQGDAKPQAEKSQTKTTPTPKPRPEAQSGKAPTEKRAAQHQAEGPNWTDRAQAISAIAQAVTAIVVMLFTGFLAWLSWRQHKLETTLAADTGESIQIARDSAAAAKAMADAMRQSAEEGKRAERAYMFLGIHDISRQENGLITCKVEITNAGRTPGLVRWLYYKVFFDPPEGEPLYEADGQKSETDLAIGAHTTRERAWEFHIGHAPFRDPYFYAAIIYEDIFREFHVSRTCIRIHRDSLAGLVDGPRAWNEWN